MVLRVTNYQTTNSFIDLINQNRVALDKTQRQIATGYKTYNPSDDAGRAGTINSLQNTLHRIERHEERVGLTLNLLQTQENVISTTGNTLIRARELATQAANGSISSEVRDQMADEIYQLRDSLVSLANTKHQGMYLYGGKLDSTPPFVLDQTYYTNPADASDTQSHWHFDNPAGSGTIDLGKTDTREVNISDTDKIRVNTAGDTIFENAVNALERLGRALRGYRTEPLAGGTPDGLGVAYNLPAEYNLQTQDILAALDMIESARSTEVEKELSSLGSRINRLDQTSSILETLKNDTEQARSKMQDADVFEAASQFSNMQTALEGLLASGSRINNLSLLNFL